MNDLFIKQPYKIKNIYSFLNPSNYNSYYEEEYLKINPGLHSDDVVTKTDEICRALSALHVARRRELEIICDIGSGSSDVMYGVANWLRDSTSSQPKKLISIDISMAILQKIEASTAYEHLLIHSDAKSLPLKDKSVDLVLLIDIIEHISNPQAAIDEALRVGKVCVIKTPIERSLYTLFRGGKKRLKNMETKYGHIQHFSSSDFRKLVSNREVVYETYIKIPRRSKFIDKAQDVLIRFKLNILYGVIFGGFKLCLIVA